MKNCIQYDASWSVTILKKYDSFDNGIQTF